MDKKIKGKEKGQVGNKGERKKIGRGRVLSHKSIPPLHIRDWPFTDEHCTHSSILSMYFSFTL